MMIKKSNKAACLFLLFLTGPILFASAQNSQEIIEGKISYITGESIYVKFHSTAGIENGDTLFIRIGGELEPALIVRHQSSISCLCHSLYNHDFDLNDVVFARIQLKTPAPPKESETADLPDKDVSQEALSTSSEGNRQKSDKEHEQQLNGRLQVSSYSNFSNSDSDDSHRFRYTLSMELGNISDSKLSAETYISFKHKLNEWDVVKEDVNNALKIYNMALKYDFTDNSTL